ncbi:cardiolipin synthase [Verrucomicrobiaceae bacterium N1E253]|uniref:Cardiolipin synthase n=1 Tax=Oceaniferula marina TaxID=2748318 RepID=A0A851GKN1_9BACT|nr:cardiolipin synthase [Oceaniferula marina]NWK57602.1 cardiolipin synthase [Oceaniferula marina]
MDPLIEHIQWLWPYVLTALHFAGALAVTLHAVLRKHDVRSAIGWIGLAWLSPVIGSVAYLLLGINRIQRKGVSLGLYDAWDHAIKQHLTDEDAERIHDLHQYHPTFISLAKLGTDVTGNTPLLGNQITPLVNGDNAYPEMLKAIREAKVSVALNSYIFDSDRIGEQFLEALKEAQDRQVDVRVMIDGVGARYSKPSMVDRLKKEGIRVAAFLPSRAPMLPYANLRNHRKILVTDGTTGFTGGTNIREGHCLKLQPSFPVACLHFKIEGPVVAELQETFAIDWAFTTGESLVGPTWFPPLQRCGPVFARGVPDGPDEDLDKINELILGALAVASQRVRIITPYFLPEESILKALAVTAMRGVEVDIILPSKNNIAIMNWAVIPQLPQLIEKGCRVYMSPAPFDHTKLFVVDGVWSLIGSTNWDARSMRLNFEYNIECYDDALAEQLDSIIDEKLAASRLLNADALRSRSLPIQLRDGTARLLSPYL